MLAAAGLLTSEQFTREIESSFRSVRATLVHVFSAESVWLSRWQGESPAAHMAPERFPDVSSLAEAWRVHEPQLRSFVAGLGDDGLHQVREYTMFNGQGAASPYWQMVTHLVNHGTYHRGQVATLMRQLGAAPASSVDLIAYYRAQGAGRA